MKKNKYIYCTIKHKGNDNEGIVEFNGTDNEVLLMTGIILHNVADGLGMDIEEFCEVMSKLTIEIAKNTAKRMEEKESNGNSAQSIDTMLSF
jgi:hypothetical protein